MWGFLSDAVADSVLVYDTLPVGKQWTKASMEISVSTFRINDSNSTHYSWTVSMTITSCCEYSIKTPDDGQ